MRKRAARQAAPDLKDAPDIQPAFQLARGVRSTIRAAIAIEWPCECRLCLVVGMPCDAVADFVLGDRRKLALVCGSCAVHQSPQLLEWSSTIDDVAIGIALVPDDARQRAIDLL